MIDKMRCVLLVLAASGCDQLFMMAPADMSPAGDGPMDLPRPTDGLRAGQISGQVCVLPTLDDYRRCSTAIAHGPITVRVLRDGVATGEGAVSDNAGVFALSLSASPATVTLRAEDPRGQLVPMVVQAPLGGAVALPMITSVQREIIRQAGLPLDPGRGAVLGYVVDGGGVPVRGVRAEVRDTQAGWRGPYFDGGGDQLVLGGQTGAGGLVAVFEIAPGSFTLALGGARQNSYPLPAAAGALTFSLLR